VRDQDERVRVVRAGTPPASCALRGRGDWSVRPAAAGSAFRAAVCQARSASASRPRTLRSAASNRPWRKPEAIEHHPHLRLDVVAVARRELVLQPVETFGYGKILRTRRIEFRHRHRQRLHLLLHRLHVVENAHALGEDASPAQRQSVLRQVPDGHALGELNRPVVERFHATKDLQQRRLAGAVPADETGPLLGRNQPGDVFKQQLRAEALTGKV
jgi:hypothetical protein